jgi:hypothetical protein
MACECIITPKHQWDSPFRLKYPDQPIPNIAHFVSSAPSTHSQALNVPEGLGDFDTDAIANNTGANAVAEDAITAEPVTLTLTRSQLLPIVQELNQKVFVLEQRLSAQPSRREQDLEIALGLVWQALADTGSPKAQPDSSLYKMMQRDAPSIVSESTSAPKTTSGGAMFQNDVFWNGMMQDIMSDTNVPACLDKSSALPGSHQVPSSESAYQSADNFSG